MTGSHLGDRFNWKEFVDFISCHSDRFKLFTETDDSLIEPYLEFHLRNNNLYITKDSNGWAFAVVRPIDKFSSEFDWSNPKSDTLLLDTLLVKTKPAALRLLKQYIDSGRCIGNTFYFRRGKLKKWTTVLTKRFFYGFY